MSTTFVSLCEEKRRLDDNSPCFRTEPGKRTTFLQWYPTDMIQRGRITGHQGEGFGNQPSLPPSCLGRSDNEGTMGLGAAKDLLRHSTSAASCNSCFEITSVVSHFSSHTRPLPFLYVPQSNLLLLAVASEAQFIQTHNLTPCRR